MYESFIEKYLVQYANTKLCECIKLAPLRGRGFPDRTIITPRGVVGFVELKRPGGRVSKQQEQWRDRLKKQNANYLLTDSEDECRKFIDELIEKKD